MGEVPLYAPRVSLLRGTLCVRLVCGGSLWNERRGGGQHAGLVSAVMQTFGCLESRIYCGRLITLPPWVPLGPRYSQCIPISELAPFLLIILPEKGGNCTIWGRGSLEGHTCVQPACQKVMRVCHDFRCLSRLSALLKRRFSFARVWKLGKVPRFAESWGKFGCFRFMFRSLKHPADRRKNNTIHHATGAPRS